MTSHPTEMPVDLIKRLSEWALSAGRFYQSNQTGYVHLYHEEKDPKAQTIPLLENGYFVLALLRSRLMDQMQEAKAILKGLLAFQHLHPGPQQGNFPTYMHEYPTCKDPALGLQLLAPFYWILTQFGHVLGSELKIQLEKAIHLALENALHTHRDKSFPYTLSVRLASAQWAYGTHWNAFTLIDEGKKQLNYLSESQLDRSYSTKHLAEILVGLQMVYSSLSQSPWNPFWERMKHTWHASLASYIGPCVREWQEKEEPQVNLYDLFGGYFAEQFSRRATLLGSHHLQGILIQPSTDRFDDDLSSRKIEGKNKNQHWQIIRQSHWAYTVLEKEENYPATIDKTHTPFRYVWGDLHGLHSCVCQGGNVERIEFQQKENGMILLFELKRLSEEDEGNSKREVEFFVDLHPDFQFYLNGYATTTFELGEKLDLTFGSQRLSVVFDLIDGGGNFVGHFMRGNRPSQLSLKGDNRFQAYDWTFFLRTIRRQSHCKIRATLTFNSL